MALINCPECGTSVSDQAEKCPRCAHPLKKSKIYVNDTKEGCFLQTLNFGCMFVLAIIGVIVAFAVIITLFD